jgi:hypothetical protein
LYVFDFFFCKNHSCANNILITILNNVSLRNY